MSKPSDKQKAGKPIQHKAADYEKVLSGVVEILDVARRASARVVNTLMTATYWEVGRRIVEHEQGGEKRAGYGEELIEGLSHDLTQNMAGSLASFNSAQCGNFTKFIPHQRKFNPRFVNHRLTNSTGGLPRNTVALLNTSARSPASFLCRGRIMFAFCV